MTGTKQKDLIKRFKSLKKDFAKNSYIIFMWVVNAFMFMTWARQYKQDIEIKELRSDNEKLREIICDIHKDTKTPAPKYDFKANKFVTGGYKYDPNLVKKLKELCKSNTH